MPSSLLLFGAGGHGKVVADIIEKRGEETIAGFLDDQKSGAFFGYDIIGTGADMASLAKQGMRAIIICIGNSRVRLDLQAQAREAGLSPIVAIHPSAQIARGAIIGEGTVVMPGAIVGPDAHIGEGCIINTGATVDHDCALGDGVHIAPGAHLAGGVTIGPLTHIGIGSAVREGAVIGSSVMVGAGSVVVDDLPDGCTAYGVPARPMMQKA